MILLITNIFYSITYADPSACNKIYRHIIENVYDRIKSNMDRFKQKI